MVGDSQSEFIVASIAGNSLHHLDLIRPDQDELQMGRRKREREKEQLEMQARERGRQGEAGGGGGQEQTNARINEVPVPLPRILTWYNGSTAMSHANCQLAVVACGNWRMADAIRKSIA